MQWSLASHITAESNNFVNLGTNINTNNNVTPEV